MLETHMREYSDDYSLDNYRGASEPASPSALELMPSSSSATTAEEALLRAKPVDWSSYGPTTHLNMYQAINSAMDIALASNPKVLLFGEDVG